MHEITFFVEIIENSSNFRSIRQIEMRTRLSWSFLDPFHRVGHERGEGDKHVLRHPARLLRSLVEEQICGITPRLRMKIKLGQGWFENRNA